MVMAVALGELVFLGFNKRVAALDRRTGDLVWEWKAKKGWQYVSLLLVDDEQLIVSACGYTYSLNPLTGEQQWFNGLSGFGTGVTSIVAANCPASHHPQIAAASEQADSAAAT
jgi:outer membrane protein assembly factor BamB